MNDNQELILKGRYTAYMEQIENIIMVQSTVHSLLSLA